MAKCPLGYHISEAVSAALERAPVKQGVSLSVDIDAYDFM